LCRVLCLNRSIRIVNLDGNRFNDDCAQAIADVFSQNEHVTHINLNKNFFENETTGRLLGQALGENQSLEELHLAWNRLNSKACGHLLKPLGTNARLTVLDLSWNGARLFAAKAIADMLKKNTVLEKLHLTNNQFDTECAAHIGKGLAKNTALKILTLNGNPLESSGCYAVVRPLIKYPTSPLQVVDLRGIIVNRDFLDLISELAGVLPLLSIRLGREREKEGD
jgi:Ran GTPase-activating protein (RanGAP) involved in mRNA processing and transport